MKNASRSISFVLTISLLLTFFLYAKQEKKASESEWKIEDVINQESAGNFQISPCGKWAVGVKTKADKKKDRRTSHLFLTDLRENGETIQLTRGDESD